LDFGVGDGGERLVELAAQVEDLTYQLSTAQEELQAAIQRAEQAEVSTLV
jgi:outer membrane murein-binding lipoprotein Lpp